MFCSTQIPPFFGFSFLGECLGHRLKPDTSSQSFSFCMDSGCPCSILGCRPCTTCTETHLFLVSFEFPPPDHAPGRQRLHQRRCRSTFLCKGSSYRRSSSQTLLYEVEGTFFLFSSPSLLSSSANSGHVGKVQIDLY